jgi:hypothetical protein
VTAIVYDCEFDELLNKFKNNQIGSQFLQTNKLLPFVLREVAHFDQTTQASLVVFQIQNKIDNDYVNVWQQLRVGVESQPGP